MTHGHAHHLRQLERREEMSPNKLKYIHMAGMARDDSDDDVDVVTVVSHITVTEAKTFPGPAVYVTKTEITLTKTAANAGMTNSYESAKSVIQQPHWRPSQTGIVKGEPLDNTPTMSSGAKAGVAILIIALLGAVAGLALFCIRRKKKAAARGDKLDEKHVSQNSFFGGTAAAVGAPAGDKRESVRSFNSTHTAATAPRLSLRPLTEFLPSILENRKSNSNLNVPNMTERSASPQNPFGDGARSASPNADRTPSWGSDENKAAAAAGAAPRGPNNVHRVQLEFKPSMDDELELKSGQLVRMLHEYDDGWALCIRMDRSQQGVCPRTCLSKLPIKPRPQGQGQKSGSPNNRTSPPQGAMTPRPLTPSGRERSNTGGAFGTSPSSRDSRHRSQSVPAGDDRPVSPIHSGSAM